MIEFTKIKINDTVVYEHETPCCCGCRNQIELFKHPANNIHKGPISESTKMYACIVQLDCEEEQRGIIFEGKHGACELYISKQKTI